VTEYKVKPFHRATEFLNARLLLFLGGQSDKTTKKKKKKTESREETYSTGRPPGNPHSHKKWRCADAATGSCGCGTTGWLALAMAWHPAPAPLSSSPAQERTAIRSDTLSTM